MKGIQMDKYILSNKKELIQEYIFAHTMQLGSDKEYGIWKNGNPYLLFYVDKTWNPFDDVCILGKYLYIGSADELIIVDLDTMELTYVECDQYFGYFYNYKDLLFVATGINVMCFLKDSSLKWKTGMLAVDGITFLGIHNDSMLEISCCMDPYPSVWCDRVISVETGAECEI